MLFRSEKYFVGIVAVCLSPWFGRAIESLLRGWRGERDGENSKAGTVTGLLIGIAVGLTQILCVSMAAIQLHARAEETKWNAHPRIDWDHGQRPSDVVRSNTSVRRIDGKDYVCERIVYSSTNAAGVVVSSSTLDRVVRELGQPTHAQKATISARSLPHRGQREKSAIGLTDRAGRTAAASRGAAPLPPVPNAGRTE